MSAYARKVGELAAFEKAKPLTAAASNHGPACGSFVAGLHWLQRVAGQIKLRVGFQEAEVQREVQRAP